MQRLPAITHAWFSLFRFRSPLLTESRLLSLPVGTEMFHFPTFPPLTLCVQVRVTGHDSCRVSPFGNPRITARLTAPRGLSQPPTSFIGSWCQGIHRAPLLTCPQIFDARVHCAVLKIRVVPVPVLVAYRGPASICRSRSFDAGWSPFTKPPATSRGRWKGRRYPGLRPFPQDPTVCQAGLARSRRFPTAEAAVLTLIGCKTCQIVNVPPLSKPSRDERPQLALDTRADLMAGGTECQVLLRKEVIQPHLPVRLPCYDFVPIADPTFDSSLSCELGHWLRVLPTFVT
jgi:hypothetical protein